MQDSSQLAQDDEVINIMIDGGEKLCDHALQQWISNKYETSNEQRQEFIARWNYIRRRIRELAKQFKRTPLK